MNVTINKVEAPSYSKPVSISQQFGQRLRKLRTERGYTQLQLASEIGIDRSYLSDVERGVKNMTTCILYSTALALSMSLSDLFQTVGNNRMQERLN